MMRRTTVSLAAVAALSLAVLVPAQAQDAPELDTFAGGATATALQLTLLGQQLGVSHTSAAVSSGDTGEDPKALADGAALLLAGTPVPEGGLVESSGTPAAKDVCAVDIDLADLTGGAVSLAEAGLACVETSAAVSSGLPVASSSTGEVLINVLAPGGAVLEPLLAPIFDAVTQITDPLLDALEPVLGIVNDLTQIDLRQTLDQLLDDLADPEIVLAQIAVAPSASRVTTTAEGVKAEAGANGVSIRVLPEIGSTLLDLGLDLPLTTDPLLTIELGRANAVVDRTLTGSTPDASAAQLLSIEANETLGIVQGLADTVTGLLDSLSISQLSCDGGLLADIVCIDLGHVNELDEAELAARGLNFGEGTVGREATAASVRVLPIAASFLGGDVLGISLGTATAAANATGAVAPAPAPPLEVTERGPLPKTGGEAALPLAVALLAVGAAGSVLLRRSRATV